MRRAGLFRALVGQHGCVAAADVTRSLESERSFRQRCTFSCEDLAEFELHQRPQLAAVMLRLITHRIARQQLAGPSQMVNVRANIEK